MGNNSLFQSMLFGGGSGGGGSSGGGGVFVVTATDGELDKTWNEIKAAYDADQICVLKFSDDDVNELAYYIGCSAPGGGQTDYEAVFVSLSMDNIVHTYTSETADGTMLKIIGDLSL